MSQATLRRELHAAIKQAGNKDSTFDIYWPIVLDFITTTRRNRGPRITRDQITVDSTNTRKQTPKRHRLSIGTDNKRLLLIAERLVGGLDHYGLVT